MPNKRVEPEPRAETRWPAVVAILVAFALYAILPSSFPPIVRYIVAGTGVAILIPAILMNPLVKQRQKPWSRPLAIALTALLAIANELDLIQLMIRLLQPAGKDDAPMLLLAAVQVWVVNIIAFALIFWQLDRGGPVTRTQTRREELPEADFRFPQDEDADSVAEVRVASSGKSDWTANFVDYLYFSIANAMAFSPPDAVPLTGRTKMLVALEALGAYALLVLVVARAVSLIG